jgi:flagellar biosynthetic protein FliR
MIGELAIGVLVGLGASLLLIGVQLAAQLAAQQAGLALGDIFNPLLESEGTAVSQLYFLVATMVFLGVGGDRAVIAALLDSFETVPPLAFRVTPDLIELIVEMLVLSFAIAIRVGAPVVLALMLSFLTLGFIMRTVPQLNILTVGFPIKIAVAMLIMAVTMMTLEPVVLDGLTMFLDGIRAGLSAQASAT